MVVDVEKVPSRALRYLTAIITSVWMFGISVSQPMALVWATQPWPRRSASDGRWRLQYRPRHFQTINARGEGSTHDMGSESEDKSFVHDETTIIAEDGRWEAPGSKKVPEWTWVVCVVVGLSLSSWYWCFYLLRIVVDTPWRKKREKEA